MYSFPAVLERDDNGTIMLTFADLPGATFGDDEADALANGVDLLETVMMGIIAERRDIPVASPADGRPTVTPGLLASLKLAVYAAMRENGWRKADLARALGVNPRQIDRLLDLRHASTVAQIEQAAAVAGARRIEVALAA